MKKERFLEIKKNNDSNILKNQHVLDIYTNIRLVTILALIVFIVLSIQKAQFRLVSIALAVILFIVSVILSFFMSKYKNIIDNLNYKNNVIKDYLSRFDNKIKSSDTGLEFSKNEYFETDLDILGKKSIYNYINFSKTAYGKKETAYLLSSDLSLFDNLKERQEASQEISNNLDSTLDTLSFSYKYYNLNKNIIFVTENNDKLYSSVYQF